MLTTDRPSEERDVERRGRDWRKLNKMQESADKMQKPTDKLTSVEIK
jgi:hypothetical protein